MKKTIGLALLAATLSGCIYTNIHSPRSYRSATPAEVKATSADETATGEACNRSLLFLVAWGNGGYIAATQNALAGKTDAVLYDVKCDVKVKSVLLGLYSRVCTKVTGKVARL